MNKRIRLTDPTIGKNEWNAVKEVLQTKHLHRGEKTKLFEQMAAAKFGATYGIALSNGTGALCTSLLALGVTKGDEVITSPFTFIATANAILMCGATPVFVDIDPLTFTIDPSRIEEKITPKTKAILTVDLYGQPADYQKIRALAKKHHLVIVADSCQAIGAQYNNRPLTQFADAVVLSFYISKNITSGEGGMVLTNNKNVATKVNNLINHGQVRGKKYVFTSFGYNYRITDLQSALLLSQLQRVEHITKARQKNARLLSSKLAGIVGIQTPYIRPNSTHVFNRYTIRVKKQFGQARDHLYNQLLTRYGIETEIAYPKPLHVYHHIKSLGYHIGEFQEAEQTAKEVLSLPIHQNLHIKDINSIVSAIREVSKQK